MIRHSGIVTNRLKDSIRFYEMLGFYIVSDEVEFGKYIDNFFGKEKLSVRVVKMKDDDNDCIELLQFYDLAPIPTKKSLMNLGLTHIAISVDSFQQLDNDLLKDLGIEMVCDIQDTPSKYKVLFCKDPNGVFIELVEG